MNKVILSVVFAVIMVIAGYFVDDAFKAKIDGVVGISRNATSTTTTFSSSENSLSAIKKKGTVVVSVQSPSKPFYYTVGNTPKGFNVEFLTLLFAQPEFGSNSSITIDTSNTVDEYSAVPKQLLKTNAKGEHVVDIAIDGLTFVDSDLDGVVYTIPYVQDFGYSLIALPNSRIKSSSDLNGKTIGILKGDPDVLAYVKKQFTKSTIVELSDATDKDGKRTWINTAITSGKVDAVIYDYPFGVSEIEGTALEFVVTKLENSDIQYKIGLRKGDNDLLNALNSAIRKVVNTPEYADLVRKYFASDKVTTARSADEGEAVYIVKRGDTLSIIAQSAYGDVMKYSKIQSRNNLANPNLISVGQKLVIPR